MTSKFASLHSGLLARKGEALPAGPTRLAAAYYAPEDRPPGEGETRPDIAPVEPPPPPPAVTPAAVTPAAVPPAAVTPAAVTASARKQGVSRGLGKSVTGKVAGKTTGRQIRRKTTLRLSADQHRRLRIAAAQLDCSQQALMVDALEAYLEQIAAGCFPDCGCLRPAIEGDG